MRMFYCRIGQWTVGMSVKLVVGLAVLMPEIVQAQYPSSPQITKDGTAILLEDYAVIPESGRGGSIDAFGPNVDYAGQLSRANFMRWEPPGAPGFGSRFFVCDLNRNLYIVDRETKKFTSYINFQAVFPQLFNESGYATGLVTFAFDPGYANNGIFYTVHVENPGEADPPINDNLAGLDLGGGYTTTAPHNPPVGGVAYEDVLVEWTDTNIDNATFEGTARELLRIGMTSRIHPMGDLLFNPLAEPGDDDYGNLYIAVGDGAAGERPSTTEIPQRLDALQGKILRITPDVNRRPEDELGENGRYRIPVTGPDPNPFISIDLPGLKKEIYALGFRNCHRISWDPIENLFLENDIGLHAWEEVNIIRKGNNYGYAEREGTEELFVGGPNNGETGSQAGEPFPEPDLLSVDGLDRRMKPVYPVAQYSHEDGDGIGSGFVYRGDLMPQLRGKYIFSDIPNGRLFYCELEEMMAADDNDRNTLSSIREIQIVFDGEERRIFDIVAERFSERGGDVSGRALPGGAASTNGDDPYGVPYGGGRADIRLGLGGDGEMYIISKSDGMIRKMAAALSPPLIRAGPLAEGEFRIEWSAIPGSTYRVQYKVTANPPEWTTVSGNVTASSLNASKTVAVGSRARFYRVELLR